MDEFSIAGYSATPSSVSYQRNLLFFMIQQVCWAVNLVCSGMADFCSKLHVKVKIRVTYRKDKSRVTIKSSIASNW